jgi:glycosyltransferase involved in cell wall biosynthesis
MKVVILSSSDGSGGAAIASYRLNRALIKNDLSSNMLVRHRYTRDDPTIQSVGQMEYFAQKEVHPRFALEKLFFLPYEKSKKDRFVFSTNRFGFKVHNHPLVKDADIIHLHWINDAFLSLSELRKILALGKPVVWTLHDMWAFTGGCHYAGNCLNYKLNCGMCPVLKNPSQNDLSAKIFRIKDKLYDNKNLAIVTCSKWLTGIVKESALLGGKKILSIPNPIDQSEFHPETVGKIREELGLSEKKIYLLFAAGNIFDERKGIKYLIEALDILKRFPDLIKRIELLVLGKSNVNLDSYFPVRIKYFGQISGADKICKIYNASHAFLLPSLQDNLPNTIMESLACGTPVIAFNTGGIPEMIQHLETGFLAQSGSSESLAEGIRWLVENYSADIQKKCVSFVTENYSEIVVSTRYKELYKELLK